MRLEVVDGNTDLPTRLTLGLVRRLTGVEVPDVIRAAAYRHRFWGTPFHALVQSLLRGRSDWSKGERELFAAFTSDRNTCPFCVSCHHEFAERRLDPSLVDEAIADPSNPSLGPQLAAVLPLLDKLASDPDSVTSADIAAVRAAGVSEQALEDAVPISAAFHVVNRVMNALGAPAMEDKQLRVGTFVVEKGGYRLPPTVRYLSRQR